MLRECVSHLLPDMSALSLLVTQSDKGWLVLVNAALRWLQWRVEGPRWRVRNSNFSEKPIIIPQRYEMPRQTRFYLTTFLSLRLSDFLNLPLC